MAATQGRLTGRPGVCLSTLGAGALNFTTGAAYAHLGAMPMLMITGQKAIKSARQARFQIVDIVGAMRPLTKMTRQIVSAASHPDHRARCLPGRGRRAPGPGASRTARGHRRRRSRRGPGAAAPDRSAGRARLGAGSDCRDDPGGEASADHDRRRRQPAAPCRSAVRFRAAHRHSLLQHADGQGCRDRRLQSLSRHGGAVGARLCPRRDRPGGPDHRHRPRHGGEAAVPDGPGRRRPEGDPCRLRLRQCRGGVSSRRRTDRRHRRQRHARSPTGSTDGFDPDPDDARASQGHPRAYQRARRGRPFPGDPAAPRA